MGLDMYLYRNGEECHYWRKANAIHNFFVENVQDGNDDCSDYDVPKSAIEDLAERCDLVLQLLDKCPKKEVEYSCGFQRNENGDMVEIFDKAFVYDVGDEIHNLLPTQCGFFFGSTEYDEYYKSMILETKELCDDLLLTMDWDKETLTYGSSW